MKTANAFTTALLASASLATPVLSQTVVVDQGSFTVEIAGESAGTEEFTIRRAGFNRTAVFLASGVVATTVGDQTEESRALLRASGAGGASEGYELTLTGTEALEIKMTIARPRFVSRFESSAGREEREFRARADTRIVETLIAHHYYFLRDLSVGDSVPVIIPRERREAVFTVTASSDDELRLGRNRVPARRVSLADGETEHVVWYDRQGRVLRVEVPHRDYIAVRRDLVG